MTPTELTEYLKAFGVPGGMAAAMLYLWTTRQQASPGKSRLEEDMSEVRETLRELQRDSLDVRERLARLEERIAMGGKQ
jgi:hypothetical protein